MNPDVYILLDGNGNLYKPSTQATALAKYSRSAKSAKETAIELSDDEADKFNDKWVITYGHSSVAELATVPLCLEGVSMIASKYLESYPRGAYSEKSTRYQEFKPEFVWATKRTETLSKYIDALFAGYKDLYLELLPVCCEILKKNPANEKELNSAVVKAKAFDIVRNLIPCGCKTNLAAVLNLRDLRYLIQDLMNSPNPELRMISKKVHEAASQLVPTLVRDPKPNEMVLQIRSTGYIPYNWLEFSPQLLVSLNPKFSTNPNEALDIFEFELENVYGSSYSLLEKMMSNRGNSAVPEVFKNIRASFDVIMDFGSFRDLARHRKCDVIYETPNLDYGYVVPPDIVGTPYESKFRTLMDMIENLQFENRDSISAEEFSYFVPMGYLHASRFTMDLKQLYYMIELRTRPSGHYSYRKICYEMYKEAMSSYPELMQWCNAVNPITLSIHH